MQEWKFDSNFPQLVCVFDTCKTHILFLCGEIYICERGLNAYSAAWKILTNEEQVLSYLVRCYRQKAVLTQCFVHTNVNILQKSYRNRFAIRARWLS